MDRDFRVDLVCDLMPKLITHIKAVAVVEQVAQDYLDKKEPMMG
jgi:hypothetical protein